MSTLAQDMDAYLRVKRRRLADTSQIAYERCLSELLAAFGDGSEQTSTFEPPVGTGLVEDFLAERWGASSARTYNKNLAILRGFFKHLVLRGRLARDPTALIERARVDQAQRATFTPAERSAIYAVAGRRDRVALMLLLDYGLRKGSLQAVQMRHFDVARRRLTIFAKGGKVRELPLGEPVLQALSAFSGYARPDDHLLHRRGDTTRPLSSHGLHSWWYARLEDAGVVEPGTTSGRKMHGARHTAGQRVLDKTHNLKAVQNLLGHASISTTGDVYSDWSTDQLAETMEQVLQEES